MNVAIDVQCPASLEWDDRLLQKGIKVVCRAEEAEHDEDWVITALSNDASVFVSPDLDIPNLLEQYDSDALWMDVPQGVKGKELNDHLVNKLIEVFDER